MTLDQLSEFSQWWAFLPLFIWAAGGFLADEWLRYRRTNRYVRRARLAKRIAKRKEDRT